MSRTLSLLVRLRVDDPVARTAEETIRKRVEGGGRLASIERFDLWEFSHRAGAGFRVELEELVRLSNLFVNPNKHAYRFAEDYRKGWRERGYLVLVRSREDLDGELARETLVSRFRVSGLERVRYGVLWVMRFTDEVSREEGLRLAEGIAVTTGPRGGLLVNPHYQEHTIEAVGPREEALGR